MKNKTTLLLVDDDIALRETLAEGLAIDGFAIHAADNVRQARHQLVHKDIDLLLLDLNLPDESGYQLLREIRLADGVEGQVDPRLPVILLSGRDDEFDRVRGFELGCDDYVTKPVSFAELRWRIVAVLRRISTSAQRNVISVGELRIDRRSRQVTLAGHSVVLTGKEYGLLLELATDPIRVFTKEELLRSVWGYQSIGSTRTLDSHACRLRKKLSGGRSRYIVNLWGTGYRLMDGGGATEQDS